MSHFLIFGKNGNAATSLRLIVQEHTEHELTQISREQFVVDDIALLERSINRVFAREAKENSIVIIAFGDLKPKNLESAERTNVIIPLLIYRKAFELALPVISLGTVMENNQDVCRENYYLQSKFKFAQTLEQFNEFRYLHMRFHTWYGGVKLNQSMFLGQIAFCLKNDKVFEMSSGLQLREYHHILDDMNFLIKNRDLVGKHELTLGNSVTLRMLALEIFGHFNKMELLRFREDLDPKNEIFVAKLANEEMQKRIDANSFRPLFPSLTMYLEKFLK